MAEEKDILRWRLVLGKEADAEQSVALDARQSGMDKALASLYEPDKNGDKHKKRGGDLGNSAPKINRWLGDIREYFPTSVVQVLQRDAMEKLGIQQMLLEPELLETLVPDVHLVATLLSLNKIMPEKTKATARLVIRKVVEELEKKLEAPLRQAINGSIHRATPNRRPKLNEIDWNKTIKLNLKHYQSAYKTIIPHQLRGYGKRGHALRKVIILVDQSGSMAASVVYSSIAAAIMASIKAVRCDFVVFDTAVVDLTEKLNDPVEVLFGTQLGGGTDINKALQYTETLIKNPSETILILISDLYEGGNTNQLLRRAESIKASGVNFIALTALSDEGRPAFDRDIAMQFVQLQIPTFACTPDRFPDLMAAAIKKQDLMQWQTRA